MLIYIPERFPANELAHLTTGKINLKYKQYPTLSSIMGSENFRALNIMLDRSYLWLMVRSIPCGPILFFQVNYSCSLKLHIEYLCQFLSSLCVLRVWQRSCRA